MKASEFMSKEVVYLTPDRTVRDAAELMLEKGISAIPVVDSNLQLVGIITESDFIGKDANIPHALVPLKRLLGQIFYHSGIEQIYKNAKGMSLERVMSHDPKSVGPDDNLDTVVDMMGQFNLKRVPVVHQGKLIGLITRHDILRAFTLLQGKSAT